MKKLLTVLLSVMLISAALYGCSNPKSVIVGTWTRENSADVFQFYEDGKCELPTFTGGGYGEESYTIDSKNMLKLTNYYSSSVTYTYVSVQDSDEFVKNNPDAYWWYIDDDKLYINSDAYYIKQ